MDYTVTYYKSDGYNVIESHKNVKSKEQANETFEKYLKKELKNEIQKGYISDKEIQNIISNGIYIYNTDDVEVTISIELTEDIFNFSEDE